MNPIEISHITKDYGNKKGVFDVTFQVREGEIMGFLGPNGAGKTTTIRQLCGFIRPDEGQLTILGMDCFRQASEIARHLGYLPGEIAFPDPMRADAFIRFVSRMKGLKDCGRAEELAKRFDLDLHGQIRRMSKGMKQKLGILCAFLHDPDILILDEPTSGLDPVMQNVFVELLLEEKRRGKTILMSSHIFEEIEKTCDRTATIRAGRLLSVEDIGALRSARQKTLLLTLETPQMAEQLAAQLNGHNLCADLTTQHRSRAAALPTQTDRHPDAAVPPVQTDRHPGAAVPPGQTDRHPGAAVPPVQTDKHPGAAVPPAQTDRHPGAAVPSEQAAGRCGAACCVNGSRIEITFSGDMDFYLKQFARYTVLDLDVRTPSLEDWFLHFYSGDKVI